MPRSRPTTSREASPIDSIDEEYAPYDEPRIARRGGSEYSSRDLPVSRRRERLGSFDEPRFHVIDNDEVAPRASRRRRPSQVDIDLDDDLDAEYPRPSRRKTSRVTNFAQDFVEPLDEAHKAPSLRPSALRDAAQRASSSGDSPRPARKTTAGSRGASGRGTSTGERRKTSTASKPLPQTPPRALAFEVVGVLSLAIGAMLLYNARFATDDISGGVPRLFIGALRALFGIGSVVVPLLLCFLGVLLIARHHRANLRAFWRGALVGFLVLLTSVHLHNVGRGQEFDPSVLSTGGGIVGAILCWTLRLALGDIGAVIFLVALSVVSLLFWSELSLAQTLRRLRGWFRSGSQRMGAHADAWSQTLRQPVEQLDGDWVDPDDADYARARAERTARLEALRAGRRKGERALPPEVIEDAQNASAPTHTVNVGGIEAYDSTLTTPSGSTPVYMSVDDLLAQTDAEPTAPTLNRKERVAAKAKAEPEVKEAPPGPNIEIIADAPPVSVVDPVPPADEAKAEAPPPLAVTTPPAKDEDDMTPVEKLEAQAIASATGGEAPAPKPFIEPPRRRFGDGPLMPHYFDDTVRALDPPVPPDITGVEGDIQAGVTAVQDTLASFKIDARVTDVKRGPVITRYEVQPAPGVRVATIANLDRDMARALSAIAVRIEAPVPGKDVVGIEVPNKKVHLVRLRDVLERHEFLSSPSRLSFVLGKDIAGQPKWADLTKMPHMLVAGATNSGKSVCLNTIISSIICRASPDEVKFSLIDPKRVELTLYRDIPHLYHPVVVEPKDAVKVLRGMIAEMDRRYKKFAERGVRNIASFNAKLEEDESPLPYIVIVIDELADLMMTAAAEFEKLICRLAQLARATGIHLIVATQRPSVNVITGVIKANIPSRIAFAVASQVDSRTILDSVGAERLIGSGDMLFDANNGGKAVRIQGAYLSEEEVNRVVEVVKAAYSHQADSFEYGLDITLVDEDDVNEANERTVARDEKKDELYDEILEYVVRNTEMSASMIQRKFEIGYPRAARIVDQFERDGILSPANGSKPRKVVGNGRGVQMESE